jgi:hypothetical protein
LCTCSGLAEAITPFKKSPQLELKKPVPRREQSGI